MNSNCVLVIVFLFSYGCVQAQDQLLPTGAAQLVTVQAPLDGRAVRAIIDNKSEYVVTQVTLTCSALTRSEVAQIEECKVQAELKASKEGRYASLITATPKKGEMREPQQCRYTTLPTIVIKQTIAQNIPIGKAAPAYAEVDEDLQQLHCWLNNVRGRAKKWFEF